MILFQLHSLDFTTLLVFSVDPLRRRLPTLAAWLS